jgi:hypothetical protein
MFWTDCCMPEVLEWNTAVGREVKAMSVIILSSMGHLPWPEYV